MHPLHMIAPWLAWETLIEFKTESSDLLVSARDCNAQRLHSAGRDTLACRSGTVRVLLLQGHRPPPRSNHCLKRLHLDLQPTEKEADCLGGVGCFLTVRADLVLGCLAARGMAWLVCAGYAWAGHHQTFASWVVKSPTFEMSMGCHVTDRIPQQN
mmetsp:Transcript_53544/g.127621  ORF Transcript_53544/g.127621 Transcript_53544/m.127621 type:complete len:155 (+) Transcript_53544:1789-2253(+)